MFVSLLLGVLFGGGVIVTWRLMFPSAPPLQAAIERLHMRNQLARITAGGQPQEHPEFFERTVGVGLARLAGQLGLQFDSVSRDLRLVGRSLEQHLAQKVVLTIFGLAMPALLGIFWSVLGVGVPFTLPAVAGLALGTVFFFAPDLSLRSEAEDRRREFRYSLGSFLDLVVISLAGGAGVESALKDAATIGDGWAYGQIRAALDVTALTGETPWAALARLGEEVGVSALEELAASISLAGTEGARVRDSLAAKASSLRDHALAEAEAEAQARTERMAIPTVLLFLGFLILIGYPAVNAVITGL